MSHTSDVESCLSEDTIIAMLDHALAESDRERADRHVASCAACRRLVSAVVRDELITPPPIEVREPTMRPSATRVSVRRLPPPGLPVGGTFGRYRIDRELGVGGMGRVYAAFDPALERPVALKVLHKLGDEASARLVREARAMARLVHPNVLTVYDVGRIDERDYVAMELVDGETLDEWARAAPRSRREVLEAFVRAGRGLAAAHAAGIVHRDFKPHNVLRRRDGRIVVTDFGLARSIADVDDGEADDAPAPAAQVTAAGIVVGTPAYMAPEQWRGEPVSPASDQFAFCVALWEALAGARPYRGTAADELHEAVMRGPDALERSGLPRGIARILRRGLRVEPAERWPSIDSLLAALVRARRRPWIALVVGSAIAVAAVAIAAWPRPEACAVQERARLDAVWSPERRVAIRAALRADSGPTASLRWTFVERALDRYAREWTVAAGAACGDSEAQAVARECLDRRLHELEATLDVLATGDPVVASHALETAEGMQRPETCGSSALRDVPQPGDAITRAKVAALRVEAERATVLARAGRARDALVKMAPLEAQARQLGFRAALAEIQLTLGKLRRAAEGPAAAEPVFRSAALNAEAGRDDEVAAEAWIQIMQLAVQYFHDRDRARDYGDHADASLDRLGRPPALDGLYLVNRGMIAWELDSDPKRALALLEQARATFERDSPRDVFRALAEMAAIYERTGEPERAVALERQILETSIRELGPDHPGLAGDYGSLAIALAHVRRFDEAIADGERGVALREIASGPASYDLAVSLHNLGGIYLMASAEHPARLHDAVRTLERARDMSAKLDGDDAPLTLQLGLAVADAYAGLDQPARAAELYAALLPRLERTHVTDKTLASARKYDAHILLALGRFADSAQQARRALAYYERVANGKPTLDLGVCLADLAAAERGLGDAAAVATATRALAILRAVHASPAAIAQAESAINSAAVHPRTSPRPP